MAARTASVTGLWSNTATWGGAAVPVDGDSVTINTGITVTFDVDQSGFATGIAGIVINGTGSLKFITNGTVTYLKMAGNISGAGSVFIGNSDADPIPAPSGSTPEVATLAFNGSFAITALGAVEMHGELRLPCITISSKTDNTHIVVAAGGPTFRAGDVIAISDSTITGNHSPTTEQFTVSAYNAGTREITLGSSLSRSVNQNSATDYVVLVSRNIKVVNLTGAASSLTGQGAPIIKGAQFSGFTTAGLNPTSSAVGATVSYCFALSCTLIISNNSQVGSHVSFCGSQAGVISSIPRAVIQDCVALNTSLVAAYGSAVNASVTASRCIALNCTTGINNINLGYSYFDSCIAYNSGRGCNSTPSSIFINCQFAHNNNDVHNAADGAKFFNCLFGSTNEFAVDTALSEFYTTTESYDHDQVSGAFKGICLGGNVTSVASPVYDASRVRSYQHAPTSATNPVFMQRMFSVPAGVSLYVRCYVRKDASMSYLPRLWVFKQSVEPFVSGSPDSEVIMTDSTNTWEILETTVTNTSDAPIPYIVRTLAKNASGNVYFDPIVRLTGIVLPAFMEGM